MSSIPSHILSPVPLPPCNQPFLCHKRHEMKNMMQNAYHHLQTCKTLHKLPTTVSCHTWVDSCCNTEKNTATVPPSVFIIIQGVIRVYCIPHTSLVWVHLCSLGVTIVTRQWAIPQQSYAIPSRDEIYLFSKNMDTHCLPSLRHGTGHKPPSDAKVENVWAITPLPHTCK
jgi:hypothetical protein